MGVANMIFDRQRRSKYTYVRPGKFHHWQFSPGLFDETQVKRSFLVETRICCLEMGHRSRGFQGQAIPQGNRKLFHLTLEMVSHTTVLSRGAKSRMASPKLNQAWLVSNRSM